MDLIRPRGFTTVCFVARENTFFDRLGYVRFPNAGVHASRNAKISRHLKSKRFEITKSNKDREHFEAGFSTFNFDMWARIPKYSNLR